MDEHKLFTKCAWRLIPFILLLYLINYIDRVNVGFAALTMNKDLSFSPEVFGFGASIFFISYSAFQVPGNVVMEKFGARRWIALIMVVWGLVSAATALVTDPVSFYILRFTLGVAEAGFFPGMLLYLTYWFPQAYLARYIGTFMMGIPLAFVIGGPISSFILELDGVGGLAGWQWLFVLEGLPASFLAFAVLKFLPDGPATAEWLSADEKQVILSRIKTEQTHIPKTSFWVALREPRIFVLGAVLVGVQFGLYGTQIWVPQIVQSLGFSNFMTGFIVAFAFFLGAIAMVACGRSSDARSERIWHIAAPSLIGAAALFIAASSSDTSVVLIGLTIGLIGILAVEGPLFSIPKAFLSGTGAAAGLAFLNTIGSLGRFLGPAVIGMLRGSSGGYSSGMAAIGACLVMSTIILLTLGRRLTVPKLSYS